MPLTPPADSELYIGLMSGTSMDGVDAVLAAFSRDSEPRITALASVHRPFPPSLRASLMALQVSGPDEIEREASAANNLARHYAQCVQELLGCSDARSEDVVAVGAHGQTTRHRPDLGFTRQTGNAALLAELTGIDVVADFRSRDLAAGGQGAPLVPAFHQAVFGKAGETRVVANIGGISNISVLHADGQVTGFDTGPGNVLLDAWIEQHQAKAFDSGGKWAASGAVVPQLLAALREETYFRAPPPKSTGRDLFHPGWLSDKLTAFRGLRPADVQATLVALTATTLADAVARHAPDATGVYICGGGAFNSYLMQQLERCLRDQGQAGAVQSTGSLGIPPNHVEALAFAWLAQRHLERQPGNLPAVTGARGPRVLGALYPAR